MTVTAADREIGAVVEIVRAVNGVPEVVGAALAGETTQLGGALTPQPRLTTVLYPLREVSVPLKTAEEFT